MPATEGRLHRRAALHAYETWIAARHGPTYREGLVTCTAHPAR
ncbi:hypothetical protein [Deinococcus sp. RM]|nr:hypothetical protein [Deinococcus sp. RM]